MVSLGTANKGITIPPTTLLRDVMVSLGTPRIVRAEYQECGGRAEYQERGGRTVISVIYADQIQGPLPGTDTTHGLQSEDSEEEDVCQEEEPVVPGAMFPDLVRVRVRVKS